MDFNKELVKKAREWLNTPWMHHQSLKKIGCDCVGFLAGCTKEAGYIIPKFPNHGHYPINDELKTYLELFLIPNPDLENINEGDILLFKFTGINCHVGIATDKGVIHACSFRKKVVEHRIDSIWRKRLVGRYQWE